MAYITTEEVKAIRNELKTTFGKKFKFSVRRCHSMSSITISVMKSPIDLSMFGKGHQIGNSSGKMHGAGEVAQDFLSQVREITHNAPARAGGREFYNNSDAMTDYFDFSYGITIEIGQYNRPWEPCKTEDETKLEDNS